jgi:hypothetical protein
LCESGPDRWLAIYEIGSKLHEFYLQIAHEDESPSLQREWLARIDLDRLTS